MVFTLTLYHFKQMQLVGVLIYEMTAFIIIIFHCAFSYSGTHLWIAKSSRIPIRLVSPYSGVDFLGRVEVFHDNQWGTICDDSFSTTDGDIVCWMLNFTQGALCTLGSARYGQGTGIILII